MKNPWLDIDLRASRVPRYVHPADDAVVTAYAAKKRSADMQLATHMLPEPWVGRLNAPVVLLLANPGATAAESDASWRPTAAQRRLAQSTLQQQVLERPFYWLDESLAGTDGHAWYTLKLKTVLADVGADRVSWNLLSLETHAYHSRKFDNRLTTLPTQQFTAEVLRKAIGRDALVIALRAHKFWNATVPELAEHERRGRVLHTNSVQNAAISPGNVKRYDELRDALSARRS